MDGHAALVPRGDAEAQAFEAHHRLVGWEVEPAQAGDVSRQARVLRATASDDALHLVVEGRPGTTATLTLATDRTLGRLPDGVRVEDGHVVMPELPGIGFEGKSSLIRVMRDLAE